MLSGAATLTEIETQWTVIDLLDANEALDLQADAEERAIEQARKKAENDRP